MLSMGNSTLFRAFIKSKKKVWTYQKCCLLSNINYQTWVELCIGLLNVLSNLNLESNEHDIL